MTPPFTETGKQNYRFRSVGGFCRSFVASIADDQSGYYKVKEQANFCDTLTFQFDDLAFHNVSGTVRSSIGINLNCSAAATCHSISFSSVDLTSTMNNKTALTSLVNAINVTGVSNSTIRA
ncbi:uncharacterized protein UDID_19036 [Ustilago sp. UG-2017a]|nr:uncharacterized protein UDID_19036 [Ustilago sp. UG-2017a]